MPNNSTKKREVSDGNARQLNKKKRGFCWGCQTIQPKKERFLMGMPNNSTKKREVSDGNAKQLNHTKRSLSYILKILLT